MSSNYFASLSLSSCFRNLVSCILFLVYLFLIVFIASHVAFYFFFFYLSSCVCCLTYYTFYFSICDSFKHFSYSIMLFCRLWIVLPMVTINFLLTWCMWSYFAIKLFLLDHFVLLWVICSYVCNCWRLYLFVCVVKSFRNNSSSVCKLRIHILYLGSLATYFNSIFFFFHMME